MIMAYRRLFIWVEGEDDERFFKSIVEPKLKKNFDFVETRRYATLKKEKINNFLKSIKAMGADYIFVTDINKSPCITAKKQKIQNKLRNIDSTKIIVVIKEIEGWYLAGLSHAACTRFKIRNFANTDEITKEQFDTLIPKDFDSRIDFMIEVLKNFSIEIATKKNRSFNYFVQKYTCKSSKKI